MIRTWQNDCCATIEIKVVETKTEETCNEKDRYLKRHISEETFLQRDTYLENMNVKRCISKETCIYRYTYLRKHLKRYVS